MGNDHDHDDGHGSHHDDDHSDDRDDDEHGHDHAHDDHHAHDESSVEIGILTVSTSRTLDDDAAGDAIDAICSGAGHDVVERRVVDDDRESITDAIAATVDEAGADVVVTTGGTGLTPDDVTPEAAAALFDRSIPGFGELFRWLSYEEVGAMAMASRATAGVVEDRLVFCLPGSENAARLGAEALIAPTVEHMLGLARR